MSSSTTTTSSSLSRLVVVALSSRRSKSAAAAPPRRSAAVRAAGAADKLSGIVFEPFNEVKPELANVSKLAETADVSLARTGFTSDCEAALNEQINIEYNISYVYHAMYAYFSRDNVALPGFAHYFKEESVEERHHAELLMDFQNRRGGRVKFQSILMPEMEFHDATKGDALYAMELALSLEKLNFSKLRALHAVADAAGDANMCDFIEGELLADQAKAVEKVANYVAQLRRVGPGLGVFEFDRKLLG